MAEYIDIARRAAVSGSGGAFERQSAACVLIKAALEPVAARAGNGTPAARAAVCAVLDAFHVDVALGNLAARVIVAVLDQQMRGGELADHRRKVALRAVVRRFYGVIAVEELRRKAREHRIRNIAGHQEVVR